MKLIEVAKIMTKKGMTV